MVESGIHSRFKISRPIGIEGSNPSGGTNERGTVGSLAGAWTLPSKWSGGFAICNAISNVDTKEGGISMETQYIRVRYSIDGGEAGLTIAVVQREGSARIGIAYRSPQDQLHKERSRLISRGRAVKKPAIVVGKSHLEGYDGRISNAKVLDTVHRYLVDKINRGRELYDNRFAMEKAMHIPRWLGGFIREWESRSELPQLPLMPR